MEELAVVCYSTCTLLEILFMNRRFSSLSVSFYHQILLILELEDHHEYYKDPLWVFYSITEVEIFTYNKPCCCITCFQTSFLSKSMKGQIQPAQIFLKQTRVHPFHCGMWATGGLRALCAAGSSRRLQNMRG